MTTVFRRAASRTKVELERHYIIVSDHIFKSKLSDQHTNYINTTKYKVTNLTNSDLVCNLATLF